MQNERYRDKKEYNNKDTLVTYRKFEELTLRVFSLWHFDQYEYQSVSIKDPYDFILKKGDRRFLVLLKYFRNLYVSLYNLRSVYKELKGFEFNKDKDNDVSLLLIYGLISNRIREELKKNYKVIILDLSNLLWMAGIDEKLESDIKSLLDFSVVDVVPTVPVGLNINKKLLNDKRTSIEYEKDSDRLVRKLKSWIPRDNDYNVYENLCVDVLKYLFDDALALWKVQERTYDNLYRYDLVCRIKDGSVSGFWKTIEQFFNSKYVIFEFKNYKEQITQREIYTTEKYLYLKALRGVAIIVSCYGTDNNAEKAIRGTLRENGKLILSVNNQGLIEMIEAKNKGREPSGFLYDQLDTLLVELEK